MRIDKPGPPTHLAPWTEIKKKDNCKIKQRKGRTLGPCRAKTPSVHWGNFMVQRFLEAVQTYTLYISMSIFYLPAFHFCFRVSQTATAPAAFELVVQHLLQGSRNRARNRSCGSPWPTHLFPPNDCYSLCIQNLFCKQSNAITNKLDFVPMLYTHPSHDIVALASFGKSLCGASWWLKEYVTDIWACSAHRRIAFIECQRTIPACSFAVCPPAIGLLFGDYSVPYLFNLVFLAVPEGSEL